ncbi:alkaline phosphatase PafA [uncultured Microscilla sp.]|uniref:alkaline phosphatase PafA n=1 Tax=uncultured Microscilla sp. TaxID=432653 RepID=UPI0026317F8F|nr:alkaline phosphatase PafA [uncultured Microscilla sp.]
MKEYTKLLLLTLLLAGITVQAQTQNSPPKLVVGIMVDQMRYDYLFRYYDQYGKNGFKKLINKGFLAKNAHYNYTPTYTGPGHASVYTGTTPANHGIIGNRWYTREKNRTINCVEDSSVKTVGSNTHRGANSPVNLLATTVGDQLRMASNWRAKMVSVSIKNRGAILPGGKTANAAYWYDYSTGQFITSTYYMKKLPSWVENFNKQKLSDKFLTQTWNPLKPISQYRESSADNTPYEQIFRGKKTPTFPYNFAKLSKVYAKQEAQYHLVVASPFGNTLVQKMAIEAINNEKLGQGKETDMLAISFSSTDIAGHAFGPQSIEVEDMYLRLDREIAELIAHLDKKVGQDNYVLFLTADHAVLGVPQYLLDHRIAGGYAPLRIYFSKLKEHLTKKYGKGKWVLHAGDQVFLNRKLIKERNIGLEKVQREAAHFLLQFEGIYKTYTATDLHRNNYTHGIVSKLQKGYNQKRSGDVFFVLKPAWLPAWSSTGRINKRTKQGTSHGSGYNYDTHVPIIFYGAGIDHGSSVRRIHITDIAPTLAMMLHLQLPNAATGQPIEELFD